MEEKFERILLVEKYILPTYYNDFGGPVWLDRYGEPYWPNGTSTIISIQFSGSTESYQTNIQLSGYTETLTYIG